MWKYGVQTGVQGPSLKKLIWQKKKQSLNLIFFYLWIFTNEKKLYVNKQRIKVIFKK